MKYVLPLLVALLGYSNVNAQLQSLSLEAFIPSNDRETGTATVSGDIDNSSEVLNLSIDFQDFSSPMNVAYIHEGTPSNPGRILLRLSLDNTELSTSGSIDRTIIGPAGLPALTKDQFKSQSTRRIDSSTFSNIANAIDAGNACIILEATGLTFAAPLTKAASDAVPTISQWGIFVLALMFSCIALIYLKKKSIVVI